MAYSDFTLERVENELDVTLETSGNLFGAIEPIPPSDWLVQTPRLADALGLAS